MSPHNWRRIPRVQAEFDRMAAWRADESCRRRAARPPEAFAKPKICLGALTAAVQK